MLGDRPVWIGSWFSNVQNFAGPDLVRGLEIFLGSGPVMSEIRNVLLVLVRVGPRFPKFSRSWSGPGSSGPDPGSIGFGPWISACKVAYKVYGLPKTKYFDFTYKSKRVEGHLNKTVEKLNTEKSCSIHTHQKSAKMTTDLPV